MTFRKQRVFLALCIFVVQFNTHFFAACLPSWFPKDVKIKAEFLVNSNEHHRHQRWIDGSSDVIGELQISDVSGTCDRERNKVSLKNRRRRWKREIRRPLDAFLDLRGGSTSEIADMEGNLSGDQKQPQTSRPISPTCSVLVSTSIGSTFLDKRKKITINGNATVRDLKAMVCDKFPGSPPVELQRLFFGSRMLNETEQDTEH